MIADMDDRGRLFSALVPRDEIAGILTLMGKDSRTVTYDGRPLDLETKIDQFRSESENGITRADTSRPQQDYRR